MAVRPDPLRALARLLGAVSAMACLVVALSFVMFTVDQTSRAAAHEQAQVTAIGPAFGGASPPAASGPSGRHENTVRRAIDDANNAITSPFQPLSGNVWLVRGVSTLLALVAFGFGLGFLARFLRTKA